MTLIPGAAFNRRKFVQVILTSTGAFAAFKLMPAWPDEKSKRARWALFSDTHIKSEDDHDRPPKNHFCYNPHANLKRVVREVLAVKPDGAIIAGDLARLTGGVENYQKLKELIAPLSASIPVFGAMGNHDERDQFAQVFSEKRPEQQSVPKHIVYVIEQGPVRFIILDSLTTVNKNPGLLGDEQLDWLKKYLAKCDGRPTFVFFHHVPSDKGEAFKDSPQLFEIITPCSKVKAVIFGHSHVYLTTNDEALKVGSSSFPPQDGIRFINLPAVGYSFGAKQAVGWIEAEFSERDATLEFHVADGPVIESEKKRQLIWRV